jgi:predicted transcriptional regulator
MATVTRSFRLSTDLEARLLAEAAREDRSVSWVIVKALESALGMAGPARPDRQPRAASAVEEPRPRHQNRPAPTQTPDKPDKPVAVRYVKNAAGRRVGIDEAGRVVP